MIWCIKTYIINLSKFLFEIRSFCHRCYVSIQSYTRFVTLMPGIYVNSVLFSAMPSYLLMLIFVASEWIQTSSWCGWTSLKASIGSENGLSPTLALPLSAKILTVNYTLRIKFQLDRKQNTAICKQKMTLSCCLQNDDYFESFSKWETGSEYSITPRSITIFVG